MNLIVDAGNTNVKLAIFKKSEIIHLETVVVDLFVEAVKRIFKEFPKIEFSIISSVGSISKDQIKVLAIFSELHELSHASKVPFKNSYASPQTLGVDRLALATAAYYYNPHQNNLVIDAGTCVTFDMINDFDEYLGGAISPGLQMRYNAMHYQTSKLPLLEKKELLDYIGNTTENCLHSGAVNGITLEIDGVIDLYKARFKNLTVILTGGDTLFLSKRLKNTIFADSKFLLKGLNYLLEYNKH
ncbi:pantothenate kinase [Maribacter sp. 6B07]|uniref:type III pantothenate kinase n=1 Tax=Maribacter TaxID=252356 RepID=UPI000719981F|nr:MULTISPECIES: type III pantothenate kinase [Maribacter]KSA13339.1 Type III pantothenate kinase [Maribacter dokdonensis DSW-8]MBU2901078.1 type III pantothenate kinase [Maribacter dokdonensis]MDP2526281.1 type III pantothenate kinase [Maribacter dokdonensis]PHN95420.1 pantothenate kinase [Maribacter sp. 6B07]|tara:strand:+ start:3468 stop:4196 length:729 start_codon:yes stop_codon:yes gene_type:complete